MVKVKCLNKKCKEKVCADYHWCSMKCKDQFLFDHYMPEATIEVMEIRKLELDCIHRKAIEDFKKSGLTAREYILLGGKFKDVKVD